MKNQTKKFYKPIFTLGILFISISVNGQNILNRLEKKATDKLNQRIENKVDQKIDEKLDQVFDGNSQSENQNFSDSAATMNILNSYLGQTFGACEVKSGYTFTAKAVIDMYSVGKKKEDSFSIRYHILTNKGAEIMGMEYTKVSEKMKDLQNSKTIINMQDSCMIMLMNTQGKKMIMSMRIPDNIEDYIDSTKYNKPIKTGLTKLINGITCYQFITEDKETKQEVWISSAHLTFWENQTSFRNKPIAFDKNSSSFYNSFDYFPLEIITTDLKSKTITYMFLRSMEKNMNYSISTNGYQKF